MDDLLNIPNQVAVERTSPLAAVYGWMTAGLAVTGVVAFVTLSSPSMRTFINDHVLVYWGLIVLELLLVFALSATVSRLTSGVATTLFLAYAALNGFTLSGLFMYYAGASIASTFFITAGTFGVLSLYGATSKRDLSTFGNIALLALVGLILATVVNLFLQSPTVYWMLTFLGLLVFVVLTATDTQRIETLMARTGGAGNVAILGALTLYLDFINLFLYLLRLFGQGRKD